MTNDVRMRAALYDRYGPPEVLYVGEVPKPAAGPGQVLVRVTASSVNGGELYGRAGRLRLVTGFGGFPTASGSTSPVRWPPSWGRMCRTSRPATAWWGLLPRAFGAAAEFVVVPASRLAPAPARVDLAEATALPGVGTTVITAWRDKAKPRSGERC